MGGEADAGEDVEEEEEEEEQEGDDDEKGNALRASLQQTAECAGDDESDDEPVFPAGPDDPESDGLDDDGDFDDF